MNYTLKDYSEDDIRHIIESCDEHQRRRILNRPNYFLDYGRNKTWAIDDTHRSFFLLGPKSIPAGISNQYLFKFNDIVFDVVTVSGWAGPIYIENRADIAHKGEVEAALKAAIVCYGALGDGKQFADFEITNRIIWGLQK